MSNWESLDNGRWNRLRFGQEKGLETELIIHARGSSLTFRVLFCGRLLGTTTDKNEDRRRQKALTMLREWINMVVRIIG